MSFDTISMLLGWIAMFLFGMMFFAFIGPFLGLPFVGFMVESKTWSERFKMALSSSIGYLIGSIITYFMITKYDIY